MKSLGLLFGSLFFLTCLGVLHAQSLTPAWEYTYTETDNSKQLEFSNPLNAGSDGSVAFVMTRSDLSGGGRENRIFWLRQDQAGVNPTSPLWTPPAPATAWVQQTSFSDIVAVRRNHLVFYQDRKLMSVVLDQNNVGGAAVQIEAFPGTDEAGDFVFTTFEQARSPGFVFTLAISDNKRSFTLKAFRFGPAPAVISAVPTFTSMTGNSLAISFQTSLGVNYQLQSSTTLEANTWQNVGLPIAGNGQFQTLVPPAGEPRLFFRVVTL